MGILLNAGLDVGDISKVFVPLEVCSKICEVGSVGGIGRIAGVVGGPI